MFVLVKAEKQFGPERREQEVILPSDNIVMEEWFDSSGVKAPNCCKVTCHGLAYKVLGRSKEDLAKAIGGTLKDLK